MPEKVVLGGLEPGVVDTGHYGDGCMELDAHACVTYVGQSHALAHPQRRETRTGHLFCSERQAGTQRQAKRPERRTNRTRRRTDGRTFRSQKLPFRSLVRLDDFDRSMPMPVRGGTMTLRRTTDDHLRARRHDVPSDVDVDGARRGVILRPRLTCMQPE